MIPRRGSPKPTKRREGEGRRERRRERRKREERRERKEEEERDSTDYIASNKCSML